MEKQFIALAAIGITLAAALGLVGARRSAVYSLGNFDGYDCTCVVPLAHSVVNDRSTQLKIWLYRKPSQLTKIKVVFEAKSLWLPP